MEEILYNPAFIGFIAGVLTYGYLYWKNDKKNKENKNKEKTEVNLLIPLAIFIIVWLCAYCYFNYKSTNKTNLNLNDTLFETNLFGNVKQSNQLQMPLPVIPNVSQNQYQFVKDVIPSSASPNPFELIGGGINIPKNLPDVSLDLY